MSRSSPSLTRNTVTPVTIILFLVSTVTGLMLLVHWNAGLVHFSHEWLSVAFSVIAIWHVARNWQSFAGYFRRPVALASLLVSLIAAVAITWLTAAGGGGGPRILLHRLAQSPIAIVAPALGLEPGQALATLRASGIEGDVSESARAMSDRVGVEAVELLMILVEPRRSEPTV